MLLVFSICLLIISSLPHFDANSFLGYLPRPSQLITSPVARDLIAPQVDTAPTTVTAPAKPDTATPISAKPEAIIDKVQSNTLQIPKIEANIPIVTTQITDQNKLHELLDFGVLLYPQSVLFGIPGQTILLGHSAPAAWPKIKYDTAFSRIGELSAGDEIMVTYQNKNYHYRVQDSDIIAKGAQLSLADSSVNTLVLVTCYPPGKDQQRLVVWAKLAD